MAQIYNDQNASGSQDPNNIQALAEKKSLLDQLVNGMNSSTGNAANAMSPMVNASNQASSNASNDAYQKDLANIDPVALKNKQDELSALLMQKNVPNMEKMPNQSNFNNDNISDEDDKDIKEMLATDSVKAKTPSTGVAAPFSDNQEEKDQSSNNSITSSSATPNIANIQTLKDIQDRANNFQSINNATRNAVATTYAMAGKTNPFDKELEEEGKQANEGVTQYEQQVEFQKQDPNSAISKTYRDMAKQLHITVNEQSSAAQLEQVIPQLGQIKSREDMIEARKEMASERLDEMKHRDDMMGFAKQQDQADRDSREETRQNQKDEAMKNVWAAKLALPSSRTLMGQSQIQLAAIDRIKGMLAGNKNLDDATPQELRETWATLDKAITGGTGTQHGTAALDPNTYKTQIANFMQKLTSNPQGAGQSPILGRVLHNLDSVADVHKQSLQKQTKALLSGSGDYMRRNPDGFVEFLSNNGIPVDLFNKKDDSSSQSNAKSTSVSAPAAPAASGGMVKFKTSDGRILQISQDKLATAQARDPGLQVLP
jgi:hypothetical protein